MGKRLLLMVAAAALVAASCVKVNIDIDVRDDGSAQIGGLVAIDAGALEDLASAFGDTDELCSTFTEDTQLDQETPGLETKVYEKDGFCGVEFSGELSADQVDSQLNDLGAGQPMTLRQQGEGWFFELPLGDDALGTEDLGELGGLFDADELLKDAEYIVRVKLPGRQIDHNADFIEGDGTMVWEIDLLSPPERLFLQTEPGETQTGSGGSNGGGSNGGLILLIVLLALAALGVAAYFLARNKDKDEALSPLPMGPPTGPETVSPVTSPPVQDFAPAEDLKPEPHAAPEPQPAPEAAPEPQPAATPKVVASPTPEQATGSPVWDPARRKYVQWDPDGARWLAYNDETNAWEPE